MTTKNNFRFASPADAKKNTHTFVKCCNSRNRKTLSLTVPLVEQVNIRPHACSIKITMSI